MKPDGSRPVWLNSGMELVLEDYPDLGESRPCKEEGGKPSVAWTQDMSWRVCDHAFADRSARGFFLWASMTV